MKAGFARAIMNPPPGTRMMGFGTRDRGAGSLSIHDDIHVRALYLRQNNEEALILSFDMCFIGREDADRFKGALGRTLDLLPRQILMNATHSHVGPASGFWGYGDYLPPEQLYLRDLEQWTLEAALTARNSARPVSIHAGMGRSVIPMNRRRRMPDGSFANRPSPGGVVCDALPVTLFKDESGNPVACVFSISAHPSIMGGTAISAEYPGVATGRIDDYFGKACAMFLQGCGGDAKTCVAGEGRDTWLSDDWSVVDRVGAILGDETIGVIERGLTEYRPALRSALTETRWPLEAPDRSEYERRAANLIPDAPPDRQGIYELWAARQLAFIDQGRPLADHASILMQGIQIGAGLRIIAMEGEPVAEHGLNVLKNYTDGVTFPTGYSNGEGLYLPVTRQLPEGGYEVDSYGEYGYPARLKPGMEAIVRDALILLEGRGIG